MFANVADMAEFWTTEQVADHLGIDPQTVYETRRRGAFPGNVGTRRGRRLLFRSDLIEAGPSEMETEDPLVALLWTAQGIETKLVEIINELKAQRPTTYLPAELLETEE
jgi:hypothetical protein